MRRFWYVFGILSPILYTAAVVVGGILWPGYSHLKQPISELTAEFSPKPLIVQLLFTAANLCGLFFGVGIAFLGNFKKDNLVKVEGLLLVLSGIVALTFNFFPQDPIGDEPSFRGQMHLLLAGIASITTIAIVFTGARAFRNIEKMRDISIILGITIIIFGIQTVRAPSVTPNIFGLFERITIGAYMLWLLICSYQLYSQSRTPEKLQFITPAN